MAKINRYDGNLAAFASQADTNRRTTFGTETTGDDTLDGNITTDYLTGWQIVGPNEFPALEDFNAAFFTIGRLMAYVHQVGMPEWNGDQEYHLNSLTNRNGAIYVCLTNNHTSITPPESDTTNWFNATQVGQNIAVFNSSGVTNWPVPAALQAGLRKAKVTGIGGGGGGGGAQNTGSVAGGGGQAGGAFIGIFDLSGVTTVPITIGEGGLGGVAANNGEAGGSTSFGAFATAGGGAGGDFGSGTNPTVTRGGTSTNTGVGGQINVGGTDGGNAIALGDMPFNRFAGNGGGSLLGGGGRGAAQNSSSLNNTGSPGRAPGAGGGGGVSGGVGQSGTGGDGRDGIIIVEW